MEEVFEILANDIKIYTIDQFCSASRYEARWSLRHAAIPDDYRLQKRSIFAGEMYWRR